MFLTSKYPVFTGVSFSGQPGPWLFLRAVMRWGLGPQVLSPP